MIKKLLLLLLLCPPAFADGNYGFSDPKLNAEFERNYYEHDFGNFVSVKASSMTATFLNVSSITLNGSNLTASTPGQITGTATNDSAAVGNVGQVISGSLARSSRTGLTSNTPKNVISISLTAGDWDVRAMGGFFSGTGTSYTNMYVAISAVSATIPTGETYAVPSSVGEVVTKWNTSAIIIPTGEDIIMSIPNTRISLSSTVTYYLIAQSAFTVSTLEAYGSIVARRVR